MELLFLWEHRSGESISGDCVTEMTARLADICKQIFKFESLLVSRVCVEKGIFSMTLLCNSPPPKNKFAFPPPPPKKKLNKRKMNPDRGHGWCTPKWSNH